MTDDRMGGVALIAGSILGIITMTLHPTGHDLLAPGRFASVAVLGVVAHALAIASMPVSFLGALALSRRLASPDRLSIAALVVYGFALAAGMAAAAISGFATPALGRALIHAETSAAQEWRIAFHYNGILNQAFAKVLAVASAAAIVLWSAAIVKTRALARPVGIYGLVMGCVIVVAVASGYLALGVHGFGLIVAAQAVWFISVGMELWRRAPVRASQEEK